MTTTELTPPGWGKIPPLAGGHADVLKCAADLCGAYVRGVPGALAHDRQFHTLEVTSDGVTASYALHLDDVQVGQMRRLSDRRGWRLSVRGLADEPESLTLNSLIARAVEVTGAKRAHGQVVRT